MSTPSVHLWAFFNPAEPPPPFAPPPHDNTKDRILLLAKYAMQNGITFIQTVQQKQAGNPEYDFMKPGGKDEQYFRWALYATGCGLNVDQPLPQGFVPPVPQPQQYMPQQHQMQMYPHPQQQPYMQQQYYPQQHMQQYSQYHGMPVQQQQLQQPPEQQRPTPPPIPPEVAGGFSQVLDALTGSKDSIKASQGWFMACAPYAAGMAYMMASRASKLQEFEKLLHLIYLANDILVKSFASQQQQASGQQQDGTAEKPAVEFSILAAAFAPALGVMLSAAQAIASSTANDAGQQKLNKMLIFWQEKGLFSAAVMTRLQQDMAAANPAAVVLTNYPAAAPHTDHQLVQQQQQQQQAQPGGPVSGWGPPPPAAAAPLAPASGWGPVPSVAVAAPGLGPIPAPSPSSSQGWGPIPGSAAPAAPGWPVVSPAAPPPQPPAGHWVGGQPHPGGAAAAVPGQYPAAVPMGVPQHHAAVPPAMPPAGAPPGAGMPQAPVPMPPVDSGPEPVSSMSFPPGLIPQFVRDKSKYSEPYAPIDPVEIERAGLPPPPEKDAYLKSRINKFMLDLRDYKPGSSRADLEEARAAARAQQGLEPDSDEELALGSTGSRLTRRKALGLGAGGSEGRRRARLVSGAMADDGSYVGPGGGRGERLGLGAHDTAGSAAELGDVYSSYRRMRSTSYHEMIVGGKAVSSMAK